MKVRTFYWALILLVHSLCVAQAQDAEGVYFFDYMDHRLEDPEIDENYLKDHPLGKDVALRVEALRQYYTYKIEGSATAPQDRTIVEKPILYYAIQKLNAYYKKQASKGGMNDGKAAEKLVYAIDVAMLVRYQQTEELEQELRKLKNGDQLAKFFQEKVKIRF